MKCYIIVFILRWYHNHLAGRTANRMNFLKFRIIFQTQSSNIPVALKVLIISEFKYLYDYLCLVDGASNSAFFIHNRLLKNTWRISTATTCGSLVATDGCSQVQNHLCHVTGPCLILTS